ncbi:MAG: LptA/OstA family protein [Lentimonas sp.]
MQLLVAQMAPKEPIENFKLPRLGDNGYTQWILQGDKGIYDSDDQVRIEDMGLRVYTGDERMALEMSMDSPEATMRIKENKAFSESTIEINGTNFRISGVGWTWDGVTKEVEVLFDTVVYFTQDISDSLSIEASSPEVGQKPETMIHSQRLKLITTDEAYRFEFNHNVEVESGDMDIKGDQLTVIVDAPKGREKDIPKMKQDELESVRQIIARDKVVITQKGRVVLAGEAEFFPRERKVNLSGTPQIEVSGAYLSGNTIRSQEGEIVILGSKDAGRAQMILIETGGLGIQGGAALAEETIVLADTIIMRELADENQFLFDGSVEVMSGAVSMRSQRMEIFSDNSGAEATTDVPRASDASAAAQDIQVGEVRKMLAEGDVRIEQSGQVATSERVFFYPVEARAVLEGSPKVTNGGAIVTGEKMELQHGLAIVRGSEEIPVNVVLPAMPDLGYEDLGGVATATPPKPMGLKEDEAPEATVVQSRLLRMLEQPERTVFRFTEEVSIEATNLEATCEQLDVVTVEKKAKDADSGDLKDRLELDRIEALGEVEILQDNRTATAEKAFIMPTEGKVVLEGDAVVTDVQGKVSGYRMTLLQGQSRAIVEGGGEKKQRATITLPALPKGRF